MGLLRASFITLSVLVLLFSEISYSADTTREVTLRWREIDGADRYEVQVSQSNEMDPLTLNKKISALQAKFKLGYGTYFLRVRGLQSDGTPGPWSDIEGFVVNPHPPQLISPKDKAVFDQKLPETGLKFEWEKGLSGSEYKIEIRDKKGVVHTRNVEDTESYWRPLVPGVYQWKVGFETPGGVQWGKPRVFKVEDKAILLPKAIVERIDLLEGGSSVVDGGNDASFYLLGRGSLMTVNFDLNDLNGSPISESASISLVSLELRARAPRAAGNPWLFSGSLNAEVIKQTLIDVTQYVPRIYLRAFYTYRKDSRWRIGPFIHFQYGVGGVMTVEPRPAPINYEVQSAKISRLGVGLGGVAVYQASQTLYFSLISMARMDLAGSSERIDTDILATTGGEFGFGVVFSLSKRWVIEARARVIIEKYRWNEGTGSGGVSAGAESEMINTYQGLDLGVGFRL